MGYTHVAEASSLDKTVKALQANSFLPEVIANKADALARIQALIPAGKSVMNGSSRTLEEIGFTELLHNKQHPWNNLHDAILAETDPAKQNTLRQQAVLSDYYIGSVHALTETGELLIASNTGSQLPHIVFTSPNIIFVVGTQKIVPTIADAFARLEEHVVPLEDVNIRQKYGMGTTVSKVLLYKKESPVTNRPIHILLVQEPLGF